MATLLQKNKGQLIPKDVYEQASKDCNTMGVAFVMSSEDTKELVYQFRDHNDGVMDWDNFNSFQEEFKDEAVLFFLGEMKDGYFQEDVQPFVIIEDDGKGQVVAFIEGDYSNMVNTGSNRTPEYHMKDKVLVPALEKYLENSKEPSLDGLMQYAGSPEVRKTILEASAGRCVVKLLAATGEITTFTRGAEAGRFDWGEISNPPVKAEEPKKRSFADMFKKKSEAKAENKKPVEEQKTVIHKVEEPKKTEAAVIDSAAPAGKVWARPKAGTPDKAMKKWNEKFVGGLHKGWKDRPWVAIDPKQADANTEFKDQMVAALAKAEAEKNSKSSVPFVKNLDNKHIPSVASDVPIIPPTQLEAFKKTFLEHADIKKLMEGVQGIPTPEQLKAFEKKYPSFFEKTGVHIQQTLGWPHHKRADLCVNYPHLAAVLLSGVSNELCKMLNEHPNKEEEKAEEPVKVKRTFSFRKSA